LFYPAFIPFVDIKSKSWLSTLKTVVEIDRNVKVLHKSA